MRPLLAALPLALFAGCGTDHPHPKATPTAPATTIAPLPGESKAERLKRIDGEVMKAFRAGDTKTAGAKLRAVASEYEDTMETDMTAEEIQMLAVLGVRVRATYKITLLPELAYWGSQQSTRYRHKTRQRLEEFEAWEATIEKETREAAGIK